VGWRRTGGFIGSCGQRGTRGRRRQRGHYGQRRTGRCCGQRRNQARAERAARPARPVPVVRSTNPARQRRGRPARCCRLGDSITEGCCTAPMGGYRIELFRQSVMNGKNITFVGTLMNGPTTVQSRTFPMRHEGHGGYTIDRRHRAQRHLGATGRSGDRHLPSPHRALDDRNQ
jgi:hypothetical protein